MTVTFTAANATVTGSGTAFLANVLPGDFVRGPDEKIYFVNAVASNTSLTLDRNYQGTTTTATVAFGKHSETWSTITDANARLAAIETAVTKATMTSATSVAIAGGDQTFTVEAGLSWAPGMRLKAVSRANNANYMSGLLKTYSANTLVLTVDLTGGSGTFADWNITPSGERGAPGPNATLPGTTVVNKFLKFGNTTGTAINQATLYEDGVNDIWSSGRYCITKPAGTYRTIAMTSSGSVRFEFGVDDSAEAGANAGSNVIFNLSSDAGAFLSTPIYIDRASGAITLNSCWFTPTFVSFLQPPRPQTDNAMALGTSSQRFSVVYAATGTINTSDRKLKTDIEPCALGLDFIKQISPVSYKWLEGSREQIFEDVPFEYHTTEANEAGEAVQVSRAGVRKVIAGSRSIPGRRRHLGLIAQDVKAALDRANVDAALWVLEDPSNPESTQSLRYDQMIAPLIRAVQELAEQNAALAERVRVLEAA